MARPRGFEPTEAIDSAMRLFWRDGYDAVSFDDLVEATGASRRGLYSLWGGKEALFAAALDHYGQQVGDHFFSALEKPGAGRAALEGFWQKFEAGARQEPFPGCLIMRTAIQPMGRQPELAASIDRYFDRFRNAFENALAGAQSSGDVEMKFTPEVAARMAFACAYAASAVGSEKGYGEEVAGLIAAGREAVGL